MLSLPRLGPALLLSLLPLLAPFARGQAATAEAEAVRSSSVLAVHPAPDGIPANPDYTVRVRVPGGEWRELFCYPVEVDMHHHRTAAMAAFDFSGEVEVAVTIVRSRVSSARIRPASFDISHKLSHELAGDTLRFRLDRPRNLSIEFDGDIFENLHLFAGPLETDVPDPASPDVIYFGPGVHEPGPDLAIPSGKTVYLAPGAVLKSKLVCDRVENVRIHGRGVLLHGYRGVEINHSKNIRIDGITVINPRHYTVLGGQSQNITITNLKSFSSQGWSDGIDLMSCSEVLVEGVFMRNSDDCIAIYAHRGDFYGDSRNITVRDSTLWADVAHAVHIGTHGNPAAPEVIENLLFRNLDILNHDEPQIGYQGALAITASDANLVRDVRFEDIRVEHIERGQLLNFRVTYNRRFATAPGRGIENILVRNLRYDGPRSDIAIISGYDETRAVRGVVFEDLRINGLLITDDMPEKLRWFAAADMARIHVGDHVEGIVFRRSGETSK